MSDYRSTSESASEQKTASGRRATGPTMAQTPVSAVDRPLAGSLATGFTTFAGAMMMTIGLFHAIVGLAAIIQQEFYVVSENYLFEFNVATWGWIHLLLGIAVAVSGYFVFSGAVWARAVGITLAMLSAVGNFLFIPYYPVGSLLIIAIDVAVIWALSVYGRGTLPGSRSAYDRGAADASRGSDAAP